MDDLLDVYSSDGNQYFNGDTIFKWLATKAEEWFTCPLDWNHTLSSIKLVFQEAFRVTQYCDGIRYFYRGINFKWLSIKLEEQFT